MKFFFTMKVSKCCTCCFSKKVSSNICDDWPTRDFFDIFAFIPASNVQVNRFRQWAGEQFILRKWPKNRKKWCAFLAFSLSPPARKGVICPFQAYIFRRWTRFNKRRHGKYSLYLVPCTRMNRCKARGSTRQTRASTTFYLKSGRRESKACC